MTATEIENELAIAVIRVDGGTQPRAQLDPPTIARYAENYRNGESLPPVVVFYDGANYWLADGFHRLAAKKLANGNKTGGLAISAAVRQGTQDDAIRYSLGANAIHGLPRSDEDKRRAVRVALERWPDESNRGIAIICHVSHTFVNKLRQEGGNVSTYQGYDTAKIPGAAALFDTLPAPAESTEDTPPAAIESTRDPAVEQGEAVARDDDAILRRAIFNTLRTLKKDRIDFHTLRTRVQQRTMRVYVVADLAKVLDGLYKEGLIEKFGLDYAPCDNTPDPGNVGPFDAEVRAAILRVLDGKPRMERIDLARAVHTALGEPPGDFQVYNLIATLIESGELQALGGPQGSAVCLPGQPIDHIDPETGEIMAKPAGLDPNEAARIVARDSAHLAAVEGDRVEYNTALGFHTQLNTFLVNAETHMHRPLQIKSFESWHTLEPKDIARTRQLIARARLGCERLLAHLDTIDSKLAEVYHRAATPGKD